MGVRALGVSGVCHVEGAPRRSLRPLPAGQAQCGGRPCGLRPPPGSAAVLVEPPGPPAAWGEPPGCGGRSPRRQGFPSFSGGGGSCIWTWSLHILRHRRASSVPAASLPGGPPVPAPPTAARAGTAVRHRARPMTLDAARSCLTCRHRKGKLVLRLHSFLSILRSRTRVLVTY